MIELIIPKTGRPLKKEQVIKNELISQIFLTKL